MDTQVLESISPVLKRAQRITGLVIREHSRKFYFATGLLTGRTKRAVRLLYGFCRATDDLVDRKNATAEDIECWRPQIARPSAQQTDPVLISRRRPAKNLESTGNTNRN
jgi:phytoene synthase